MVWYRSSRLMNGLGRQSIMTAGLLQLFVSHVCAELFLRCNQLGYEPDAPKSAIVFGDAIPKHFQVVSADKNQVAFEGEMRLLRAAPWGKFTQFGELDFSAFSKPGRYFLRAEKCES